MDEKITVLLLAYNEERRIANVIKNLKGFDQIIVLDKSSTDKTAIIAESMGAKVLRTYYYNDTTPVDVLHQIKKYLAEEQSNEWILHLTSSDIIHHELLSEMQKNIAINADRCDVIEVPSYRYSMGITGKNTFFGGIEYNLILIKRKVFPTKESMIHESPYAKLDKFRMRCSDPKVAIYHLTHPNLELVMDRHWRYAGQYVKDAALQGRNEDKVMHYSVNECIRLVYRYFRKGIFKAKTNGKAQLMMLVMYNCMIFLNAFFNEAKENEIQEIYGNIIKECGGEGKHQL